ncbi:hypothetical protein TNCV_3537331 [Trichonephila clavipes]|nr:hypothetical protein TNCV_3537331 [Trichonephila clavipes]
MGWKLYHEILAPYNPANEKLNMLVLDLGQMFSLKSRNVAPELQRQNEDRYLAVAQRNRRSIIRPVSSALFSYRYDSFEQTVYRQLGHIGLYASRPFRCLPLTATPVACD